LFSEPLCLCYQQVLKIGASYLKHPKDVQSKLYGSGSFAMDVCNSLAVHILQGFLLAFMHLRHESHALSTYHSDKYD